jgi:cytochrome c oxidase subunit 2
LEAKLNDPKLVFSDKIRTEMEERLARKEQLIRLLHQMKARHTGETDKQAMDDFITDTLFLCKGENYEFTFRSKDVIHSAYIPHLRAQMNTVPGAITRFKLTPSMTTQEMREEKNDENFNYILMCNKICGGAHYNMNMIVVVLDKAEYKAWWKLKTEGAKDPANSKMYTTFPATFGESYYKTLQSAQEAMQKELDAAKAAEEAEVQGEEGEDAEGGEVEGAPAA